MVVLSLVYSQSKGLPFRVRPAKLSCRFSPGDLFCSLHNVAKHNLAWVEKACWLNSFWLGKFSCDEPIIRRTVLNKLANESNWFVHADSSCGWAVFILGQPVCWSRKTWKCGFYCGGWLTRTLCFKTFSEWRLHITMTWGMQGSFDARRKSRDLFSNRFPRGRHCCGTIS